MSWAAAGGVGSLAVQFGGGYVDLAVELGVPTDRIDTIIDLPAAACTGAKAEGMATVKDPAAVLTELAGLVAAGQLTIPITRTCPLDQVQDAFRELAQRHTRGKIVLLPWPA